VDGNTHQRHTPPNPAVPIFGAPTLRAQTPNALTALRLTLAVVFVWMLDAFELSAEGDRLAWAAAALFALAALTDALDGWLARRWNAISVFGRVMDPLADKLLVLSAFILLAGPGFHADTHAGTFWRIEQASGITGWMACVILARELLVTSLRGVCESRGVDFSASFTGKAKMVVQSVGVPIILIIMGTDRALGVGASICAVIGAAVTAVTALSAVPYVTRAAKGLSRPPKT